MSRRPIAEALAQSGLAPARAGFVWTTGLDTFRDEAGSARRDLGGRSLRDAGARLRRSAPDDRDRLLVGDAGDRRGVPPGPPRPRGRGRRRRRDDDGDAVLPRRLLLAAGPGAGPRRDDGDGADDPARACRPFDRERRGFALAEGGAALVLEPLAAARARGAPILAEIVGFGTSQDAHDLNRPPPDGAAAELCMRRALDDAGLTPDAIGAVNAHATGTRAGDPAEAAALRRLLGARWQRTPVSSVKGALGHAMSAAGAPGGHRGDFIEPHRRRPADDQPAAAGRRLRAGPRRRRRARRSRPDRCSPARSGWAGRTPR